MPKGKNSQQNLLKITLKLCSKISKQESFRRMGSKTYLPDSHEVFIMRRTSETKNCPRLWEELLAVASAMPVTNNYPFFITGYNQIFHKG